ncbi:MAG: isoleucyl-tRNA synthetase [Thermoproteota archaeon]|nr:isoleucyl-tRNA synthetase [Thermoproteota archaeon]
MMKVVGGPYDSVEVEKKVSLWWNQNRIFQKMVESKKGAELFRFLEGPPTVNGFMHVGHARGRAMKDVVLRYKTMAGYDVWRRAGWDCQGLPVELEVEKKFGISSKKEIEEKIGLQKFVEECQKLVDFYLNHWRNNSERLGLWLDYDLAYETRKRDYIEFVWWALKEADKKGLLTEDFKVVPRCPRCETSLSSHEVAQGYATTTDPSIYVKFPIQGKENEFIIIWTTTPWTLPGDEAVSIHPRNNYTKVSVRNEVWILAEQLVERVMKDLKVNQYKVIDVFPGKKLEGTKYIHPLLEEVPAQSEHKGKFDHAIICGEHVTLEEGTGCVHTAPAHGPEDFEIGKKYSLPIFCPVSGDGHFTSEGGKYAGLFVKESDSKIIADLEKKGLLLKASTLEHEYPFCWRCNTPLIYLADKQWFLKVESVKKRILEENKATSWVPDWAGSSRFEDWLANSGDWCISRSRVWGSPLPVWICQKCGNKHVVGTLKELTKEAKTLPENLDLHRPWIDEVVFKCGKCGEDMRRVEYVLDCWLDSGVAHSASIDYLKDKRLFEILYPYDFITEAIDQTRGWFYSLVFTGVILFDNSPYKRVLCQGLMLDRYGQKMSKSKGNVIWASEAMEKIGADPLRVYILWKSSPWDSLSFDYDETEQVKRWLSILWNIFSFATTYMNLDEFNPNELQIEKIKEHLRPEDRWLLSRTQSLVKNVTANLDALYLNQAIRDILTFITEDLSRFYIRLIRRRTWVEKKDPDKQAVYATLYESLSTILRILAPFAPYVSEELYQALVRSNDSNAPESVHMAVWPRAKDEWIDDELEANMALINDMLEKVYTSRQRAKLKLRWPVQTLYVSPLEEKVKRAVEALKEIFLDQANAKTLEILEAGEIPTSVNVRVDLNFQEAGPQFKEKIPEISSLIRKVDGRVVKQEVFKNGKYFLTLRNKEIVELSPNLLVFKEELPENLTASESSYSKIYLDITRTPELLAESLAKEVLRRAQIMRKEMNLKVDEYVDVAIKVLEDETLGTLQTVKNFLATEIRAQKLSILQKDLELSGEAYVKEWEIDGETITICITRLNKID